MIYLIIALAATIIGAISGVGGGVIIKPILDFTSDLDVGTINLLSSFTVLAMSISSIIRHIFYKTHFEKKTSVLLAVGAIAGGLIGDSFLEWLIEQTATDKVIKNIQNLLLLLLLVGVLIYMNFLKENFRFQIQNTLLISGIGIALGMVSTFLGIGGGPINMVVLAMLFSMDTKEAAVNSLLLILFSQMSKIGKIAFTQGFSEYHLYPLIYMIPAGIAGGLIGSGIYKKLQSHHIMKVFNLVLVFIIVVNILNIFR